jgi:hypothetical protein
MPFEIDPNIESNFLPGALSRDGFLGDDKRTIPEIIGEDGKDLARLGTNPEAVANFLQSLIDEGKRGLEGSVGYGGLTIRLDWARGLLSCPFGDPRLLPKITATVTDGSSGRMFRFSQLTVHLIREHGFFGGRGCPFRVEPMQVVELIRHQSITSKEGLS